MAYFSINSFSPKLCAETWRKKRADGRSNQGGSGVLLRPARGFGQSGFRRLDDRKWKLVCGGKEWLVKQYSRKRFSQKQLDWIEESMQRQIIAQREGVPCPRVLSFRGKVLRTLADGTTYMVMEFCPGVMPGSQYRYDRSDVFAGESLRTDPPDLLRPAAAGRAGLSPGQEKCSA